MAKFLALLITFCLLAMVVACAPTTTVVPVATAAPKTLTIFAAASLTEAFSAIGKLFEARNPGVTVAFNLAGSQQLAQQLAQGAPADVFASANDAQMNAAIKSGRIADGSQRTFAHNRLVVIAARNAARPIAVLQDLARPGLKIALAAKEVPVGQYALDFMDKASADAAFGSAFKANVLQNVVSYEENVRAVLAKVALGEADAGIVYTTDVVGNNAPQVVRVDIPNRLNTIASYPIASIADSANPQTAQAFVTLVLSPDGQAVLGKYGFTASNALSGARVAVKP